MIAGELLSKGVEQGIITAEQAERLRALEGVREPLELPASPDDEQLRFISGFSDIFVTIGLAMFLGAIGYFALSSAGRIGMWVAIAVTAWLLAEFFTRLRRMALPSIVLLIVFAVAVFMGASSFIGADLVRKVGRRRASGVELMGEDDDTAFQVFDLDNCANACGAAAEGAADIVSGHPFALALVT